MQLAPNQLADQFKNMWKTEKGQDIEGIRELRHQMPFIVEYYTMHTINLHN